MSSTVVVKPCRGCGKHFLVLKGEDRPDHECRARPRLKGRKLSIGTAFALSNKASWLGVTVTELVLAIITGKSEFLDIFRMENEVLVTGRDHSKKHVSPRRVYITGYEVERIKKTAKILKILEQLDPEML